MELNKTPQIETALQVVKDYHAMIKRNCIVADDMSEEGDTTLDKVLNNLYMRHNVQETLGSTIDVCRRNIASYLLMGRHLTLADKRTYVKVLECMNLLDMQHEFMIPNLIIRTDFEQADWVKHSTIHATRFIQCPDNVDNQTLDVSFDTKDNKWVGSWSQTGLDMREPVEMDARTMGEAMQRMDNWFHTGELCS